MSYSKRRSADDTLRFRTQHSLSNIKTSVSTWLCPFSLAQAELRREQALRPTTVKLNLVAITELAYFSAITGNDNHFIFTKSSIHNTLSTAPEQS